METNHQNLAPNGFRYQKLLHRDALRLLKLLPAPPHQMEVDAELIHVYDNPGGKIEEYEAVSWCWGTEKKDRQLHIRLGDRAYPLPIPANLEAALRALRYENAARYLWIDYICIDQGNTKERNEQVPKLNEIYGRATNVCIWLGEGNEESQKALHFIRTEVLSLWDFDTLCGKLEHADHWLALINLMKRPWFSRRWVVQEISLAKSGILYCGRDWIDWQDFADAVSLFVEVESAGHRLSEVMQRNPQFNHIRNFFGEVPGLGAALLVDATSNLFRPTKNRKRVPISSLENLVSHLAVFETSEERDTIYSLLAISKDTSPDTETSSDMYIPGNPAVQAKLRAWIRRNRQKELYRVDYDRPVIDVFKDFVAFSIRKCDRYHALDILCRPWAPPIKVRRPQAAATATTTNASQPFDDRQVTEAEDVDDFQNMPSWMCSREGAALAMREHPDKQAGARMERQNGDPLVGLPSPSQRNYSAAGDRRIDLAKLKFQKRSSHYSMFVEGFELDEIHELGDPALLGNIPKAWLTMGGWRPRGSIYPPDDFWRTLVADRGPSGRNPPSFYPRACRESFRKSGIALDTTQFIEESRSSVVAEFFRRVQRVIWNRRLIRTKENHLGLAHGDAIVGDKICILYGCSVPVILRKLPLDPETMEREAQENQEAEKKETHEAAQVLLKVLRKLVTKRKRKEEDARRKHPRAPNIPQPPKISRKRARPTSSTAPGSSSEPSTPTTKRAKRSVSGQQNQTSSVRATRSSGPRSPLDEANASHATSAVASDARGIPNGSQSTSATAQSSSTARRMPRSHYWKVIGECYVHNMRNGEAIDLQGERQIPPQIFELR